MILKLFIVLWLAAGVASVFSCRKLMKLRNESLSELLDSRILVVALWVAGTSILICLGVLSLVRIQMLIIQEKRKDHGRSVNSGL